MHVIACAHDFLQAPPALEMKDEYDMKMSALASRQQAKQRQRSRSSTRQSSLHSRHAACADESGELLLALPHTFCTAPTSQVSCCLLCHTPFAPRRRAR